jgi:hypothetical protein
MKPSELLLRARDILLFMGWAQNSEAYDEDGMEAEFFEERASKFCMTGALSRAFHEMQPAMRTSEEVGSANMYLMRSINRLGDWVDIPYWNDRPTRTLDEVIAAYDEAIRLAKDADS